MSDLTDLFRATVQDLSQASGLQPKSDIDTRSPPSKMDPWLKEAHQISRTMADLRAFIITTRPAYLNLARGGAGIGHGKSSVMRLPRHSDSIPKADDPGFHSATVTSSKVLQQLLETVSSLTSLSDKDRDSIDTQTKVMMRQIKGAIEELESLEQERRKKQQKSSSGNAAVAGLNQLLAAANIGSMGPVDNLAQHRQGVTLYLNERLASLATLHKDQYEARIAREMEKRESSLFRALPKPNTTNMNGFGNMKRNDAETGSIGAGGMHRRNNPRTTADDAATFSSSTISAGGTLGSNRVDPSTGVSSSQYYHHQQQSHNSTGFVDDERDFEQSLSVQERQMLELENENIVQKLETELNQVRQLESSMMELSSLHSTIQEHLEVQTLQTNRLHEEALTAINHIDSGNDQLIKAGKRNNSTRKWILFFLILTR
ncbi:hypothetical protein BG011_009360 [Mortierella polycephala]|uniref:SNARE-complex protein Syntaxin-18 N-terminal domain-containing protein n=1 Tax=Mortierella polycephala TaxID=41804 RepID=A0A9P6QCS3_9FUNG|nr:hypothetical protein BG011_009360 [Mortierella polycephala]